ncbi:hypothetical protein [Mycolicibacterium sp. P9-22]|uniref:hypothetical protein n=1 Tax=Mycolicibacterium sp. P9-22 TaxID=2024613 RepID=UPI0011ED5B08|nr:hypothetical protein [Mycolicibacterium sp. P9-22]
MTAAELVASIDLPDATVDYGVDQFVAKRMQIDAFMARIAELAPWRVLIPSFLPEIRHIADGFMDDYRTVSADRDVWRDIPDCPDVDPGDDMSLRTHDPRGGDGLPENVPIALYRDGTVFHRVYCWGSVTLDDVYDGLCKTGPTKDEINRNPLQRRHPDPGCDLHILPEAAHRISSSREPSPFRATSVWPIQRGDFVILLRTCSACVRALFQKYEIGPCAIEVPWGIG